MPDLISKKTRLEFREFLVGMPLRQIRDEFYIADIEADSEFEPDVFGQRRTLVEQYYKSLDFSNPSDVRRLLIVYGNVLEKLEVDLREVDGMADQCEYIESILRKLILCLSKDGMKWVNRKILPASPFLQGVFDSVSELSVSELTRRNIIDEIIVARISWQGRLSEEDFLARIFDLESLPSFDYRFSSFLAEYRQHRGWGDWPDNWVFTDSRINLLKAPDETFLRFICLVVHPVVRTNESEISYLLSIFNKYLQADGWKLVANSMMSGQPVYDFLRLTGLAIKLPEPEKAIDVLSDDYVIELADKCDARILASDFDGAITIARTMLEAVMIELELRLVGKRGDYKGDLPKQFKQVAKLLRMDDERQDLDDRFKDVIRGLIMVVNGLAPLRNKMSDGHARVRKPAAHHARMVVNTAKTIAMFLVDSYVIQIEKGTITTHVQG